MNLEQFGGELGQVRLAKGISLLDISAETRINIKFLEAIERGQFHLLPQTYVRAFLREYALMLDLDPQDVMQRYKAAQQEGQTQKPEEPAPPGIAPQRKLLVEKTTVREYALTPLRRNIIFGIILLVIVTIVIILANLNKDSGSEKSISEIPFDRVIRENEATTVPPPPATADSVPVFTAQKKDSLRLQITTIDSVWISLVIDGTKAEEHLFAPNKKRTWSAKERFAITMGNAGGATFLLNGKELGSLGKRGAVVRNSIITEANLKH